MDMDWIITPNVAQYKKADWKNFVKKVPNCTLEQAKQIALDDPLITFFFFCNEGMVLEGPVFVEHGAFKPDDAVFFSGEPWYGSAPQCDSYRKSEEPLSHDAYTALQELTKGYQRYHSGNMTHLNTGHDAMQKVALHQTPKACILCCSDSRVPPEIIFDQGLGDLFVVRVAGNFADEDDTASLEYAVQHFDPAPAIIVVMGHERCGAIQAAAISFDEASVCQKDVEDFKKHPKASDNLNNLVRQLKPAIENTKPTFQPETDEKYKQRLDEAVRFNIIANVNSLRDNEVIREQKTFVIGARYDLDLGEIEWFDPLADQGRWIHAYLPTE